ncbi:MAG: hypothetical protein ACTS8R_06690 [Arsenophonus sp. NC-QC1-MAG3]
MYYKLHSSAAGKPEMSAGIELSVSKRLKHRGGMQVYSIYLL